MNVSAADGSRVPTEEEVIQRLRMASKRAPRILIIFDMMIYLFEDTGVSGDDIAYALTFFEFCCGHPRVAMFLACAGEFLRGDDDQPDTPQADHRSTGYRLHIPPCHTWLG